MKSIPKLNPKTRKPVARPPEENPRLALMKGAHPPDHLNREGELAWNLAPLEKLVNVTATLLFGERKFYDSANTSKALFYETIDAAMKVDPAFVLKLALYARTELYLRSTPQVLLVRAVMSPDAPKTKEWHMLVKAIGPAIMQRADEPLGVTAYLVDTYWKALPENQEHKSGRFPKHLRHAIETRLNRLTEYEAVKYFNTAAMKDRSMTIRNLLRLVHPRVEGTKQNDLFRYLLNHPSLKEREENPALLEYEQGGITERHLAQNYCYTPGSLPFVEAMKQFNALPALTEIDQVTLQMFREEYITRWHIPWNFVSAKFGKQKWLWDALAPVMPIQALLMNLRNILQAGADVKPVIEKLTTPEIIQHSKLFPFRFLTAYRILAREEDVDPFALKSVRDALEQAIQLSVANLPTCKGRTLVAADNSGSMDAPISDRSVVLRRDIANVFAALASHLFETAIVGAFSDDFRIVPLSSQGNILPAAATIGAAVAPRSTNGYKVMDYLLGETTHDAWRYASVYGGINIVPSPDKTGQLVPVERIILFTDQELWSTNLPRHIFERYERYCAVTQTRPFVYLIDVAGYGETCFPPETPKAVMISGWSENLFKFIAMFEAGLGSQVDYIRKLAVPATATKEVPADDGDAEEEG